MKCNLIKLSALCLAAGVLAGCTVDTALPQPSAPASSEAVSSQVQEAAPLQADPLNGGEMRYPGQRPVAVMVNSDGVTANQWGVSRASVVVEAVTSGQQTSMMCLFSGGDDMEKVGPVAAGDDLFLQIALPVNAIPMQINKTVYASNLLNVLGYQDLDGYHTGVTCFDYDSERGMVAANEFCWYTSGRLMNDGLSLYNLSREGWTAPLLHFDPAARKDTADVVARCLNLTYGHENVISFDFREDTGRYVRLETDGTPQLDALTGEDVCFDNVVVLYVPAQVKDDGYTRDYLLTSGSGFWLNMGRWEPLTWSKGEVNEPLQLFNAEGGELALAPGSSYIGILGGFGSQAAALFAADGTQQEIPALA